MANFSSTGNGQFNAVFGQAKSGLKADVGDIVFGLDGKPGKDFSILGYYDTLPSLEMAVKSPSPGDAYGVGLSAPYDVYIWDAVGNAWKNNGPIGAKNKIDKVADAIPGDFPVLTDDGQLQDSGKSPEDFAPPMMLGVEYKTAEKYNGKPLYAKLVNFGSLPSGSSSYVSVGENVERVFIDLGRSVCFQTSGGDNGGYNLFPSYVGINVFGSYGRINIMTNSSTFANYSAYIYCRYTKTTD